MSKLFDKLNSKATVQNEESVDIIINRILATNNPQRVVMKCAEGDFFCFTNVFPKNIVPVVNKPIKATMLLREKGEYVNVVGVNFDTEQLGKHNLVASYGNAVVL